MFIKRRSLSLLLLFTISLSCLAAHAQEKFAIGSQIEDFSLNDTAGTKHSLKSLQGKNGVVLVFLSIQCPYVKDYNDRINALAAEYAAKGINFVGINSNATESPEAVRTHAAEHYKFPVLLDVRNVIADKLGASVTPEAYYFNAAGKLLFRGAIDNSRNASRVTEQTLRTAFDESLSGKAVTTTSRNAFGCTIKRVGAE